ncbi:MAG: hypothetical protein K940chlam9_01476 [Chlamydiae bacterium]|nr:hypothetical protein [Chlamydiota bacterium]
MTGDTSGVGSPTPQPLQETQKTGEEMPQPSGRNVDEALHGKVRTLGQLKSLLTSTLGEKEGTKLYNSFMTSMAMLTLDQVKRSAERAKQASKQME